MILKALSDYYDRMRDNPDLDVPQPGFEKKPIPFVIVLNEEGGMVSIRDTRTGEGKKKIARPFLVPQGEKKTSGIKANLMWDNPQYVLAVPKGDQEKDRKKAEEAFQAFLDRFDNTFPEDFDDIGIRAVRRFIHDIPYTQLEADPAWPDVNEENANLAFMLFRDDCLVSQRPSVHAKIREKHACFEGDKQACGISGDSEIPALLHTAIKGVWGAQPTGANIVSFNKDAFCSFKKEQGMNAPVGQKYEFAYTTALNILLARGSKQRMQVGDASTVFWAGEAHPLEEDFSFLFAQPPRDQAAVSYDKIRTFLSSVRTGITPEEEHLPFYILGLAPNASRIAIRFWYAGTVGDLKRNILQYFDDIDLVRGSYEHEWLSLFQLLASTAIEGKADNVAPNLGGEVMRAILTGGRYPYSLLIGAVNRGKAEQRISHARAAAIKAVLTRNRKYRKTQYKEVDVSLDKEFSNIGYVLGRLFAVFERIQESAQGGGKLNKTLRDTYFGAACSTPQVIFKRLQELAVHHLAKVKNTGKSTVWLEKLLGEIMALVPPSGIPASLRLEDQGRFAVGYYHQRHDFFSGIKNNQEKGDNQ